jgi:hypothetical protein
MDPSRHSWLLGQSHPVIRLVLIAIGVEAEYRFVSRSLSAWGPKWEPNTPITIESETMDLLRLLKLIWQPNLSMLAIGVETEYRSVTRSLSGWGPKGESNARLPLRARSQISWGCWSWPDLPMIAIAAGSEVTDLLRLLKSIWRSDSSMIAITAGSEVTDFCYRWRYHAALFGLAMPCW